MHKYLDEGGNIRHDPGDLMADQKEPGVEFIIKWSMIMVAIFLAIFIVLHIIWGGR